MILSEHDPSWIRRFEVEASAVRSALGSEALVIEHIGSTAIPGLIAKPVIDMLVGLAEVPPSRLAIERMQAAGYTYLGDYGIADRAYFANPSTHVHCFVPGTGQWDTHLLFRQYLREVPAARQAYAQAKLRLIEEGNGDREYYVQNKEDVVAKMLDEARSHFSSE